MSKQVVLDFLDCWHRRDLADAVARLAPDAVFQPDLKSAPIQGREAIHALWSKYMETILTYDATVGAVLGSDRLVFVERVEQLGLAGGRTMVLPIVGIFEIDPAGLITAWRDYWDTTMAGA